MTLNIQALMRLQTWLSPAFPIGSFAFSHGLEFAISKELVCDRVSAQDWLEAILQHGSGWNDALIFLSSWNAGKVNDAKTVSELIDLAQALQPSRERWLETIQQGKAFYKAAGAWSGEAFDIFDSSEIPLPVVAGVLCGLSEIERSHALAAYLNAFTSNLVWICVRLIPLGQSDGLAIIAELELAITKLTKKAIASSLDDLGNSALMSDIASMSHENMETRICLS